MAKAHEQAIARYRYWYRKLLRFYTRPYRERFAESMEQTFNDLCRERAEAGEGLIGFVLWVFIETSAGIFRDNGKFIMTQNTNITRIAFAAALTFVAVGIVMGKGDPEAMSLFVLPVLVIGAIAYTATNNHSASYRTAVGVALAAAFILFWMIGGVGLMGTGDRHPADLMYILVPIVGIIGAISARCQPRGMARAALATALAQLFVPVIVVIAGMNLVPISYSQLISFTLLVNGPFAALYVGSAWLFRKAAVKQISAIAHLAG